MGHLADHGEDRSLGRLADRAVGLVSRTGQGGADQDRVDELAGAAGQLLGSPADQLGEDHARVAAGAEQRGAGDRGDDLVAPDLVDRAPLGGSGQPVELLQHGPQGEDHVVPGVPVGDGEHVEVVDLLAAGLERGQARLDQGSKADDARIRHAREACRALRGHHLSGPLRQSAPGPLLGFDDLAGLEAARADVDAPRRSAVVDADALQIGIEAPPGGDHRMAAVVTECRSLGAHMTDL